MRNLLAIILLSMISTQSFASWYCIAYPVSGNSRQSSLPGYGQAASRDEAMELAERHCSSRNGGRSCRAGCSQESVE